jgi:hypothetical protein
MAGDHVCFPISEAPRKYFRFVWELDKILSQRPEAFGHVWSISCLLGARAIVSDPANMVYRLCNVLNSWALLQKNQDRGRVEEGVLKLKLVIREAYARTHGWAPTVARIC